MVILVVAVTLLLAACCLVGGVFAALLWRGGSDPIDIPPEDLTAPATYGGLVPGGEEDPSVGGNGEGKGQMYVSNGAVDLGSKAAPERRDRDGDGRADIETDESGRVITSAGNMAMSIPTVVNRVAASVVEITTETVVKSGSLGQYVTSGAGSGVILDRSGIIITNHHVISGASQILVRTNDGTEFSAELIGTDEDTDIALIRIRPEDYELTVATMGASFDLVVGEQILAIGNPMGSLGGTVTEGIVSATARQIKVGQSVMTLLQVSAPINPGNSGGGLFNMAGALVGIVNAKVASDDVEGLGFAIPVDTAYEVAVELLTYGYVRGRPQLDFQLVDVTSVQTAMRYFNSVYTGVYVYGEDHETLQYGDRILSVDGQKVTSVAQVESIVAGKQVGDDLTLEVYRKGSVQTLKVTIAEKKPQT